VPALDYTDLDSAKAIVLERFGPMDEDELEALLASSACTTEDGDPFYQPYLLAGHLLRTRWLQYRRVKSAAGSEVEWNDPGSAFDALAKLQDAISGTVPGLSCPAHWRHPQGNLFEAVF
jgi:hypothetical protein